MVLFTHVGQTAGFEFSGSSGVTCFFILSGYLACVSLENCKDAKTYYKKRIVKIIPTYYTCLILLYVINLIIGVFVDKTYLYNCGYRFIRYFLFLHQLIPSDNYWVWSNSNALWTMSTFALFYLIAPYIKKYINNIYKAIGLTILFVVIAYFGKEPLATLLASIPNIDNPVQFVAFNPIINLWKFFIGFIIYYSFKNNKQLYLLAGCVLAIVASLVTGKALTRIPVFIYTILITLAIIWPNIIKNDKIVNFIGKFSKETFTLYLIHPMTILVVSMLLRNTDVVSNIPVYTICLVACSFIFTHFVYSFLITKFEKKLKKLIFK